MARVGRLPGRGPVLVLTFGCALLAVLCGFAVRGTLGDPVIAVLCAAGVVLSEARPLHFAQSGERRTFTFAEAPLVVGLVVSSGLWLAIGFAVAILLTQVARRLPRRKVAFNVAQYAAASAAAVVVALHVSGTPGVLLGVAVFALVNDIAVQLVLRITAGTRLGLPFADRALVWFLHLAGATSVALLAGRAIQTDTGLALAFIAPLLLIAYSEQESMKQHVTSQVERTIADQAVTTRAGDRRAAVRLVSAAARNLMAAEQVQLLVFDGPWPLLVTEDNGTTTERRLDQDWFESGAWYARALESGTTGVADGRWAAVVVGGPELPQALLAVTRVGQEPFRGSDLVGLRMLGLHAATWLTHAGPQPEAQDPHGATAVADLDGRRQAAVPTPRVLDLLSELDRLRSSLASLSPVTGGGLGWQELEEVQRRLTDALAELLGGAAQDEGGLVPLGSWEPRLRRAAG
jgi:hypothetical protein